MSPQARRAEHVASDIAWTLCAANEIRLRPRNFDGCDLATRCIRTSAMRIVAQLSPSYLIGICVSRPTL